MEQTLVKEITLNFNRRKGKFQLSVGDECIEQNICEFLQTISHLVGKDVEEHLMNPAEEYDHVRVPVTRTGKVLTLDLGDFIRFREIYSQQMFFLKLEDLLHRKGISQLPASL
jgi:hypothetical protein